jgi:hypothetical protein
LEQLKPFFPLGNNNILGEKKLKLFQGAIMTHPKLLDKLNFKSKGANNEGTRSWGTLPGSQHFGGRGACWNFEIGLRRVTSESIFTWTFTNQTIS